MVAEEGQALEHSVPGEDTQPGAHVPVSPLSSSVGMSACLGLGTPSLRVLDADAHGKELRFPDSSRFLCFSLGRSPAFLGPLKWGTDLAPNVSIYPHNEAVRIRKENKTPQG